jgi:hypothetical protein
MRAERGPSGRCPLDVWWQYPTPAEPERRPSRLPFHDVPNVLITPHSSSSTEATADRRWSTVAANLDPLDARADAAQPEGPHRMGPINRLVDQWLTKPRILHPWPNHRFAVKHPRWQPDAGMPHVRLCVQ